MVKITSERAENGETVVYPYYDVRFDEPTEDVPLSNARKLVDDTDDVSVEPEIPEDYDELEAIASEADSDEIDGRSSEEAIIEYLETLDSDELVEAIRG